MLRAFLNHLEHDPAAVKLADEGGSAFVSQSLRPFVVAALADQDARRPALVVDAIGHDQENVAWAVLAARAAGQVYAFGLPEEHYVLPMHEFFRKRLTLRAGDTDRWPERLAAADRYVQAHPALLRDYITVSRVRAAFLRAADPAPERVKVVLEA